MAATQQARGAVRDGETRDRQGPMETPAPDYLQFGRMWLEFLSKMTAAGGVPAPDPPPIEATRELRDTYFQTLNRGTEQFLRSPQFLEMMRESTELGVAMRQQFNELLAQMHQALGGVSRADVDSLHMALRRCEGRVLDRLDEIAARLKALENVVNPVESEGPRSSRKAKS